MCYKVGELVSFFVSNLRRFCVDRRDFANRRHFETFTDHSIIILKTHLRSLMSDVVFGSDNFLADHRVFPAQKRSTPFVSTPLQLFTLSSRFSTRAASSYSVEITNVLQSTKSMVSTRSAKEGTASSSTMRSRFAYLLPSFISIPSFLGPIQQSSSGCHRRWKNILLSWPVWYFH